MKISGLTYIESYVDDATEARLLEAVDAEPWLVDLKRRVQHYGYRYDYKARKIDPSMYLGPLPSWSHCVVARLTSDGLMAVPDQLIVNEYLPGQGISGHVDCLPCFGPVICSLSLGSACVMELFAVDGSRHASQMLERRSLLVLSGESRSVWRYGIRRRVSDEYDGRPIERARRVSLTFRTVMIQPKPPTRMRTGLARRSSTASEQDARRGSSPKTVSRAH